MGSTTPKCQKWEKGKKLISLIHSCSDGEDQLEGQETRWEQIASRESCSS